MFLFVWIITSNRYKERCLTKEFINRVFECSQIYDGEMDYKHFLDFVLAIDGRRTPQGIMYLFKLLDIWHQGYLDSFTINYFFRAVVRTLEEKHGEEVRADVVGLLRTVCGDSHGFFVKQRLLLSSF
jgi:Ca2+-binding EF-hand superfamily protein